MSEPRRRGILDTSAVIRVGELHEVDLPLEPMITAVTLAELTVGPLATSDTQEQAARQLHVQNAEASFGEPLAFDARAARSFGRVAADLRSSGRKPSARAFDALIAAVALSHDLPVYTFNPRDFEGIGDLEIVALP